MAVHIPPPAAAPFLGLIAPASLTQRRATVPSSCPSIIMAGVLSGPLPGSVSRGPAAVRVYIYIYWQGLMAPAPCGSVSGPGHVTGLGVWGPLPAAPWQRVRTRALLPPSPGGDMPCAY